MHEELVSHLRECAKLDPSENTFAEAADAIEYMNSYAKVLEKIADYWCKRVPKWIPVTERLPEENEAVNIVFVNKNPPTYYQAVKDKPQRATGVYYRGQWYWWSAVVQDILAEYGRWEPDKMDDAIVVTHWMPLPEPPKEDENGNS